MAQGPLTGVDDQGPYVDTGEAIVATTRASTVIQTNPPVVVDSGTATTKTPVPPARPATQRR